MISKILTICIFLGAIDCCNAQFLFYGFQLGERISETLQTETVVEIGSNKLLIVPTISQKKVILLVVDSVIVKITLKNISQQEKIKIIEALDKPEFHSSEDEGDCRNSILLYDLYNVIIKTCPKGIFNFGETTTIEASFYSYVEINN